MALVRVQVDTPLVDEVQRLGNFASPEEAVYSALRWYIEFLKKRTKKREKKSR
jgi:hypothetical protein